MKIVRVRVPESITEEDVKLATAVDAFKKKLVSLNRATEIAELSLQEFLVELKRRDIQAYPYTDEEALRELKMCDQDKDTIILKEITNQDDVIRKIQKIKLTGDPDKTRTDFSKIKDRQSGKHPENP